MESASDSCPRGAGKGKERRVAAKEGRRRRVILGRERRRRIAGLREGGTETAAQLRLELVHRASDRMERGRGRWLTGGAGLSARGRGKAAACWAPAATGPQAAAWAGAKGKEKKGGDWAGDWCGPKERKRKRGRKKELFPDCLEFGKFWRDANGSEFKL